MPRIRTLTPEEAGPQAGEMLENFKRTRGNIPNMYRTLAHRPEIATTLAAHQAAVMTRGEVPNLLKEFISVRVSQINNCDY